MDKVEAVWVPCGKEWQFKAGDYMIAFLILDHDKRQEWTLYNVYSSTSFSGMSKHDVLAESLPLVTEEWGASNARRREREEERKQKQLEEAQKAEAAKAEANLLTVEVRDM